MRKWAYGNKILETTTNVHSDLKKVSETKDEDENIPTTDEENTEVLVEETWQVLMNIECLKFRRIPQEWIIAEIILVHNKGNEEAVRN